MTKQSFQTEKEGQIKFFEELLIDKAVDLSNNTDGIYKGTIFEFKLNISDINKVLFQAIKYLSHLRIKGNNIPKNILLISLNEEIAYLFDSKDVIKEIQQIYNGATSKNNAQFDTEIKPEKIKYDNLEGLQRIKNILTSENWTKIHIDVFCVVGWAKRYYNENPNATKIQLFNELRVPKHFKEFIHKWNGDETDFKYIMDCLNDRMHRKELGAFYTPPAYCKKATELVRKAIKQVPKEHNYIILDRCAGTGNLEEFLTNKNVDDITIAELDKYLSEDIKNEYLKDKKNVITTFHSDKNFNDITMLELEAHKTDISIYDYLFDNELSHCIVNTHELKEWVVLNERIGDKVKMIIPPPIEVKNMDSLVNGGDALSEIFITGKTSGQEAIWQPTDEYFDAIKELNSYVNNPDINIIMFENPPYRVEKVGDGGNDAGKEEQTKRNRTESFVRNEMQKIKINGEWAGDLGNQFIWSAFEYYIKKDNDALIIFSPVKYFKSSNIFNKTFIDGFLLNRKYFHATESTISCILWNYQQEYKNTWQLPVYDIIDNKNVYIKTTEIKKCYSSFNDKYRSDYLPETKINIACALSGYENIIGKKQNRYLFDDNVVAAMEIPGYRIEPMSCIFTRIINYRGRGMYLSKNNFIEKLPLFCAKLYPQKNWYERDIYFTTADGGDKYTKDTDFLKKCFIFTCLSQRNHCLSFNGSDGNFYKNELCFDKNTLATAKLKEYQLTKQEEELLNTFYKIVEEGKKNDTYNSKFTYGTYQIDRELNTRYKDKTERTIYNHPELNTKITTLKNKLSKYYEEIIQPKLFEYELLK